jgi:hypothetical protein
VNSASHPIWSILRLAIIMLALYGVLRLNAEDFNAGEIRTIFAMGLIAASAEGGSQFLRGLLK